MSKGEDKKKGKDKKNKEKKVKEKKPKVKRDLVFDLSDGVQWQDIVGLFILFFVFLWRLLRLVLAPIFWVFTENVRMYRFIRASGKDRTMTEDEQLFVESLPLVFTLTGMVGGVLIGIFAAFSISEDIDAFIDSLKNVAGFFDGFFGLLGSIIGGIWGALVWIVKGTATVFGNIVSTAFSLFEQSPMLAFLGLATIGIVAILIWVTLAERGVFQKLFGGILKFLKWIVGSPDRFRFKLDNYYRRFNHKLTVILIGEATLLTRTHIYFKRAVFYTVVASLYSFIAGIFVGTDQASNSDTLNEKWEIVLFISFVLFVAGVLSGTLFFGLMSRFLDLLNRKKYISPEFKSDDGSIDSAKMKEIKDKAKVDRDKAKVEYHAELDKMQEDKPWKKKAKKEKAKAKPAKKVDKKPEAKAEVKPDTEKTKSE